MKYLKLKNKTVIKDGRQKRNKSLKKQNEMYIVLIIRNYVQLFYISYLTNHSKNKL